MDPELQEQPAQTPPPTVPLHDPQDIEAWAAAFGDCV